MDSVQFKMNLPLDVKRWIEDEARATNRSQSAMVVTTLRAAMPLDFRAEPDKGATQ